MKTVGDIEETSLILLHTMSERGQGGINNSSRVKAGSVAVQEKIATVVAFHMHLDNTLFS